MPSPKTCITASLIVSDVSERGTSLTKASIKRLSTVPEGAYGEIKEIAWGTIRWYFHYKKLLAKLLHHPLEKNEKIIESILLCGFYQLDHLNEPDYSIIFSTVESCKLLKKSHMCGLVNAVMRRNQKNRNNKTGGESKISDSMPIWLTRELQNYWPDYWISILEAYNEKPPMSLRVNIKNNTVNDYLNCLSLVGLSALKSNLISSAITLSRPLPVSQIPGFAEGHVSVQDTGAQLTPLFTGDLSEKKILDACSAPGGKACHLLEFAKSPIAITCLDLPERTDNIKDNLDRLGLNACVISGDALHPERWWNGKLFDFIIIDAPCSATGVIRRHPDIRLNRRKSDILKFSKLQISLLTSLWPLLQPGGRLLYITCSILPPENDQVIERFLSNTQDAKIKLVQTEAGIVTNLGIQLLPQPSGPDGFFYAMLERVSN